MENLKVTICASPEDATKQGYFAPQNEKLTESLKRRPNMGSLIPVSWCQIEEIEQLNPKTLRDKTFQITGDNR